MKSYQKLLKNIITNGVEKESGRANMPNTIGISHAVIQMDMKDGFPLLTTKKMFWKGIVHELLWFLRGDTNIKYLVDNKVKIWNGDAYRWYQGKSLEMGIPEEQQLTIEDFITAIKNGANIMSYLPQYQESWLIFKTKILKYLAFQRPVNYKLGDLGKVYGFQWRNQNGVDQVKEIIDGIQSNPYSRYHILNAWNKSDFKEMALPPCHLLYQFIVRPLSFEEKWISAEKKYDDIVGNSGAMVEDIKTSGELDDVIDKLGLPKFYLDLNMYQRSCDTFLGVPFNLASMSLFLSIIAKSCNMIPGVSTWIGGDTHLYVNHVPLAEEQMSRKPFKLPELVINSKLESLEDILNLNVDDFKIMGYESHPEIKGELFNGIKK